MRIISGDEIATVLTGRELVETLRRAYRSETVVPDPGRFEIERPDNRSAFLKVSPAWTNFPAQGHTDRGYIGCTLAVDLPALSQGAESLPGSRSTSGVYLLMSGTHGHPIALLDGVSLGIWRSCAQHALAMHYLAREDASRLLVLGRPPHLEQLLDAYCCVRDIRSVLFVGADQAQTCKRLSSSSAFPKVHFDWTDDVSGAISGADIICCPPGYPQLLEEHGIAEGVHIDMLGQPDSLAPGIADAARLFVGDRNDSNAADLADIAADLRELAQGIKAGRRFYSQTTLFMSGDSTGLPDLATAGHVFLRT
ncbi:ornithine cyclodeaminase [Roseibium sp.]|uniref:ornithine cyclodeaminase n=1 Tax=Roseibium sp. TaxID=1936156 RepID=UPI003A96B31C